mgnify:CR=1 FL=1
MNDSTPERGSVSAAASENSGGAGDAVASGMARGGFLDAWADAALTTLGFFWMALWAFCLGYIVSSLIQVFVTRERMRRTLGGGDEEVTGLRAVGLAAFFGFVSSSCSFAALSTARSLFQKGAGLAPSLAFLLASTNLVIELGILIAIFLSWQFVVGEYVGGLILIGVMWLLVRWTAPKRLVEAAREHANRVAPEPGGEDPPDPKELATSRAGWGMVGSRYLMEWGMVWKDVTFGFTVAGVIAAFVPPSFFRTLFIGSGAEDGAAWWQVILHTLIGPVAAFFTFIGSMGNIPLAAILFSAGVSFAGIMAFIFSDLVVFPVLRISASYFGWKMAAYIVGVFLASLVIASLVLHYGFHAAGLVPSEEAARATQTEPSERFAVDYTLFLNAGFVAASGMLYGVSRWAGGGDNDAGDDDEPDGGEGESESDSGGGAAPWSDRILRVLAIASFVWLAGGVGLTLWGRVGG